MRLLERWNQYTETDICFQAMCVLNFIIIVYMSSIVSLTQIRAARLESMEFLSNLETAPLKPGLRIFLAITCYILICLCMMVKSNTDAHTFGKEHILLSVFEVALVFFQLLLLDMSYNGIIFFIVADFLRYMESKKSWFSFLIFSCIIYLLSSSNLVGIFISYNQFSSWLSYYDITYQNHLMSVKMICEVFNIVLFLAFIIFTIQKDRKEKIQIAQLNRELKDANNQLHLFAMEKEQMGETKERNRLAREIHDSLGHVLTGISVGTEAVKVLMDLSPDQAKQQLDTIGDMARSGLNDVRRSVRKLKPDSLESRSLEHAIYEMADNTSRMTGTKIYFVSCGESLTYEADEEETIFRLVQEGTTNALRHGNATEVWIRLDKNSDGIEINLRDNGCGSQNFQEGFGLTHMRERVEMLGGIITFSNEEGFQIHAVIPIRRTIDEQMMN